MRFGFVPPYCIVLFAYEFLLAHGTPFGLTKGVSEEAAFIILVPMATELSGTGERERGGRPGRVSRLSLPPTTCPSVTLADVTADEGRKERRLLAITDVD